MRGVLGKSLKEMPQRAAIEESNAITMSKCSKLQVNDSGTVTLRRYLPQKAVFHITGRTISIRYVRTSLCGSAKEGTWVCSICMEMLIPYTSSKQLLFVNCELCHCGFCVDKEI